MENEKQLQVIKKETSELVVKANSMVITNKDQYEGCAGFLRAIKKIKKQVNDTFDQNISDAHKLHKNLVAKKKEHYDPLNKAEQIVKQKSLQWIQQERLKAEAEQRKKEEVARKEEEKIRKAKEEQERKWREKAEKLRAEGKEDEAEKAEEKADERQEEAETVHVAIELEDERPEEAEGQSVRKSWTCEVVDLKLLCEAIAHGELPESMVKPNMPELNTLARAMKNLKSYPGIKFIQKEVLSVKA